MIYIPTRQQGRNIVIYGGPRICSDLLFELTFSRNKCWRVKIGGLEEWKDGRVEEWKGGRMEGRKDGTLRHTQGRGWAGPGTIDDGPWLTGDGGRETGEETPGFSRWTLGAGTDAGAGSEPERQVLETPGVFWYWAGGMAVRGIRMPGIRMPGIRMPGLQLSTKLVGINGIKLISVHE
jgi:hypothetical protein